MREYGARTVEAAWIRTIKVYQEFHGRRANGHLASPFGILIFIDERFILTLSELGGHQGKLFDDSAFAKFATVGHKRHKVLPVLVLGNDGGADGLRAIEYALSGGETSTFVQRNGNASRTLDRNGRGVDSESNKSEQSGLGEHDEWGRR